MKKFLAMYMGTPPNQAHNEKWSQLGEEEQKAAIQKGMQAWGEWMGKHQDVILDAGGPLGKTKSISDSGIEDISNQMTGYIIFNAETHEAAAQMFEAHPHFAIFPGESVEVMEIMPMPGQ